MLNYPAKSITYLSQGENYDNNLEIDIEHIAYLYEIYICLELIKKDIGLVEHHRFISTLRYNPEALSSLINSYKRKEPIKESVFPLTIQNLIYLCLFCKYKGSLSPLVLNYLSNLALSIKSNYLESLLNID